MPSTYRDSRVFVFIFPAILLLLLCVATYGNILSHNFFMLDDYRLLIRPAQTEHRLSDFFLKSDDQHYAPLNAIVNVVLFKVFQKPFPLLLINLILFYINCFLLFIFVYLLSREFITALLTSIIFCVHPMSGEILQHITFNILMIQTIFIQLGLIALYLYSKSDKRVAYYFFSIFMVILALFCQEIVLLFPLYAAALLFFFTDFDLKKIVKTLIPFVLLDLLLILLILFISSQNVHLFQCIERLGLSFWSWGANFFHLILWYISNLFYPNDIVFMYNVGPLRSWIWLWVMLFGGFLIGGGVLVFYCFKKSLESFCIVLFLIGFIYAIPASLIRPDIGFVFEPYWFYFSSMGFYLFIVLMLLRFKKYINKTIFSIFLLTLFVFYFICTQEININASSTLRYFENWLQKSPHNPIPMRNLALIYSYKKNIDIPAAFTSDMLSILNFYIRNDSPEISLKLINKISSSKISFDQRRQLHFLLAAYHCKYGLNDKCNAISHQILSKSPNDPYIYMQLSDVFYEVNLLDRAMDLLEQCKVLYPRFKEVYLLEGLILERKRNYKDSISTFKQGAAIDPTDLRFILNIDRVRKVTHQM